MRSIMFADAYGGAQLVYGGLSDATFSAPVQGSVTVTDLAALRDPIASRVATISYADLPRVIGGSNDGYFGPLRLAVSGPDWAYSGSEWALINTTLPARCRIEAGYRQNNGAWNVQYRGGPFVEPVPGQPRNLAFDGQYGVNPFFFTGYFSNNWSGLTVDFRADFYLPFGSGSFTIGRLFIGATAPLAGLGLTSERNEGIIDYSPRAEAIAGTAARRLRAVCRTSRLIFTSPEPRVAANDWKAGNLPLLLDYIGANSHVVLCSGVVGDRPMGDGPWTRYGLLRPPLTAQAGPADRMTMTLEFIEAG